MKITPEDYAKLKDAMSVMLIIAPGSLSNYQERGLTERRWRWDLLHAATQRGLFSVVPLYKYMHDDHIDTALKVVIQEIQNGLKKGSYEPSISRTNL